MAEAAKNGMEEWRERVATKKARERKPRKDLSPAPPDEALAMSDDGKILNNEAVDKANRIVKSKLTSPLEMPEEEQAAYQFDQVEQISALQAELTEAEERMHIEELAKRAESFRQNGDRVFAKTPNGIVSARVLNYSTEGKGAVNLAIKEGGFLKIETRTLEEFDREQDAALEREIKPENLTEKLAEAVADFESAAPDIFKQATDSKWKLLKQAGKLFSILGGAAVRGKEIAATGIENIGRDIKNETTDFLKSYVDIAYDDLRSFARMTGSPEKESVEIDGEEIPTVGTKGVIGTAVEYAMRVPERLWGAPKDIVKAFDKSAKTQSLREEAKFTLEGETDFAILAGREKSRLEKVWGFTKRSAVDVVRGTLSPAILATREILAPSIRDSAEAVAVAQGYLSDLEPEQAELQEQAEAELSQHMADMEQVMADFEHNEMLFDEEWRLAENELDHFMSRKYEAAIKKKGEKKLDSRELMRLREAERSKRELDAILADMIAQEKEESQQAA